MHDVQYYKSIFDKYGGMMRTTQLAEEKIFYPQREKLIADGYVEKIRIFRDFMVKNELFSITSADFTASPERVVPRRVPKMAPFFQNRTKLLLRRRVARVFFCFYDRNIGEVFFGRSAPAEILVAAVH